MTAGQLVARRAAQAAPLLLVVSMLVFALLHAAPGGPLDVYLGSPNVRPEDIERLKHAMGLDRSVPIQYVAWLGAFVRGDWGYSFVDGRPVVDRIMERVPASLELMTTSLVLSLAVSLGVAVFRAVRRGTRIAHVVDALSIAGISLPVFWLGLVLQIVFAVSLRWLPSSGRVTVPGAGLGDQLAHLVLPAAVLAAVHAAAWSRYLGASLSHVLQAPYVRAARSRGVPPGLVLWRHALRNALLPFITVVLLDSALMVSGAVVTESVFAWPGLGGLFSDALVRRDYAVLMAFLMASSAAIVVLNLVADVAYHLLDSRTREA